MEQKRSQPVVLAILDGWGIAPASAGNPLATGATPVLNRIVSEYPSVTLRAAGAAVGLTSSEQGNSEVGHLTIGSGRVIFQALPKINLAIHDGVFFRNQALLSAAAHVKENRSTLHIIGLLSSGNVHGSFDHIVALLKFAKKQKISQVYLHAILDGRDVPFNSGVGFIRDILRVMKQSRIGQLASVSGRYYAMDRDNRWERTERAYHVMTGIGGEVAADPISAISASYGRNVFDEEFVPTMMMNGGKRIGVITDGDAVIFSNFRPDRMVQLATAFSVPAFDKFPSQRFSRVKFVSMAGYGNDIPTSIAFPFGVVRNVLAEVVASAGLTQLHVAETEKFAHITYFLNGMRHEPFIGESRIIVPSPKVASYDEAPEMAAGAVADAVAEALRARSHDFIVLNLANADMVGHTGKFAETQMAAAAIDRAISKMAAELVRAGGVMVITADHGNAEEVVKLDYTGHIDKEHSTNHVPFIVIGRKFKGTKPPSGESANNRVIGGNFSILPPVGMLADVAPTILKLLQLPIPADMTGNLLI